LLVKVAFGNVNYEEKGRPEYLENKFLEQGQEPTTKCKTCNNKKGPDHHFSEVQSWNLSLFRGHPPDQGKCPLNRGDP